MSRWEWMNGFLYSSIFHVRSHYFHVHVSDGAQNEHFVTVVCQCQKLLLQFNYMAFLSFVLQGDTLLSYLLGLAWAV